MLETDFHKQNRFFLNMGPQHPSTHGVLLVLLEMSGEYVLDPQPVLGYIHRMHEKMAESRPVMGFMPNTARMDYVCALPYNHGYVALIERKAGIEVPPRAEYVRVITSDSTIESTSLIF